MNRTAKLTIIFGTYKDPELIIPTLDGLRNQHFKDFVVYVVDDNHPDELKLIDRAKEVISGYNELDIHYIKNDINIGVPHVYRKWISLVKTEYFYICGAGDKLMPDALSLLIEHLECNPLCSLAYGLDIFEFSNGQTIAQSPQFSKTKNVSAKVLLNSHLLHGKYGWSQSAAMYRYELSKHWNIQVERFHYWDFHFHCEYLLFSKQVCYINKHLCVRRVDNSFDNIRIEPFLSRIERLIQSVEFINKHEFYLVLNRYSINKIKMSILLRLIISTAYTVKQNQLWLIAKYTCDILCDGIKRFIIMLIVLPFSLTFNIIRKLKDA